ncbi:unnamed protein product [Arctogadus glacialis]
MNLTLLTLIRPHPMNMKMRQSLRWRKMHQAKTPFQTPFPFSLPLMMLKMSSRHVHILKKTHLLMMILAIQTINHPVMSPLPLKLKQPKQYCPKETK